MTTNLVLEILVLLSIKHFILDFPLQTQYHILHKGIYGHPGGLQHAGLHGIGTFFCLFFFVPMFAVTAAIADAIIHYHVDWIKMKFGNQNIQNSMFWTHLGLDQLAHTLTYIAIVACI